MEEIDAFVAERVGRKIRVAGACIGTDAHTVGIDAILNMKGYKGDYGLERYQMFETFNLGSQIAVEDLVRFARSTRSTRCSRRRSSRRKGSDIKNFTALAELLEAEGMRDDVVLICGGPRVTNLLASELGYDAGFGRGTLPSEVASFIAARWRSGCARARRSRNFTDGKTASSPGSPGRTARISPSCCSRRATASSG